MGQPPQIYPPRADGPQGRRRSCRLCSSAETVVRLSGDSLSAIASSRRQGGPPYQNLFFFGFLSFVFLFPCIPSPTHNHLRRRNLGQLHSERSRQGSSRPSVRTHRKDHWGNIWLPRRQFLETADEELKILSHSAEPGTVLPALRIQTALQIQTTGSSQSRSTELGKERHLVRKCHGLLVDALDKRNTGFKTICCIQCHHELLDWTDEDLCFRL